MRRMLVVLAAMLLTLGLLGGPAAAHHLVVDPPGAGEGPSAGPLDPGGWVGGPLGVPGKGQGLNHEGGPTGEDTITPAHHKGLNSACESLRQHGNGVVDIFGPPPIPGSGCPHGE